MPAKLSTTISKVKTLSNGDNSHLILEFHEFMKENGASERHQNNNLKAILSFSQFPGSGNLIDINERYIVFYICKG